MKYSLKKLSNDDVVFFTEMLPYVSSHIEEVKCEDGYLKIQCIDSDEEEVRKSVEKLEKMITAGDLSSKQVKIMTLDDFTRYEMLNRENIFQNLLDQEIIKQIAEGVYAYSDLFLEVFHYFNKKIEENGSRIFGDLKKYEFPVIYPLSDYQTGGYFESFPHHIMFQTLIKNDIDVIDRFTQKGVDAETLHGNMRTPVNVLRHAACVPVYSFLRDSVVEADVLKTFMVSGKCFRNEERNVCELSRLNEFYMKEYVFVGTKEQCDEGIEKSKQLWYEWIEIFGLNSKIDTATDSFFASNYKKLKLFQILGNSKQEYKVRLTEEDNFVSCGSVNYHRTHFTKPYNIKGSDGAYCYSACCAFGIDRLTYTLLSQKGLDPEKWDRNTYKEIFG